MVAKTPLKLNQGPNELHEFEAADFVDISDGGTGGITDSAARTALGLYSTTEVDNIASGITGTPPGTLDTLEKLADAIDDDPNFHDNVVMIVDIVNNLTSMLTNQPLSAAQGKVLKDLIDGLSAAVVSFDPSGLVVISGAATDLQLAVEELDAAVGGLSIDHGDLTGLLDDDHTQYFNNTRGDARYYTQGNLNGGALDTRYYTETETDTLLLAKQSTSEKNAANGYAGLTASGKILESVLPDLAISEFLGEVASEAAMLLLTGERGDWCIRTDLGTTFVAVGDDLSILANWKELATPGGAVISVNGHTGVVVLDSDDLLEGAANLFMTVAERAKLGGVEDNAKDDQDGADVPYTPSGGLTSTDVQAAIDELIGLINALVTGVSSVNGQTGAVVLTTTNINEGSNLYYTDARVATYLDRHIFEDWVGGSVVGLTPVDFFDEDFTTLAADYMVTLTFMDYIDDKGDMTADLYIDTNLEWSAPNKSEKDDKRRVNFFRRVFTFTAASHNFRLEHVTDDALLTGTIENAVLTVERWI